MDKQRIHIALYAAVIYLISGTFAPAVAVFESSWGNGTHFCGVSDYHPLSRHYSKRQDNRNYARTFASNQNVGAPRTVRMIYFLPNDRPYRADEIQWIKDEIHKVQTFYADQMEAHGYGRRTFRVETDSQGEPIVHRVDGKYPDSYYIDDTDDTVGDELVEMFKYDVNIYLTVIDISTELIDREWGGRGLRWGKQGGEAWIANFSGFFYIVAHELGHAFGLHHDFSDGEYIMSYGGTAGLERWRLSQCHAEYLSVHPYFNPDIPVDAGDGPTVEWISPHSYPSDSKSVSIRVRVSDPDGLHQVILRAIQSDNRSSVKACRGLAGRTNRVIEFDYDGVIPSAHDPAYSRSTSLSNPLVHQIMIFVVNAKGDEGWAYHFYLLSDDLQPLMKISGDNQAGLPNTELPAPFVVEARNLDDGFPLFGVPISFTVTTGGGSLSVLHTEVDGNGRAESVLTLGPNLKTNTVTVSAAGIEGQVTFTAVAGSPVDIPDPTLRAAIEYTLDVPPNTPIAPAAMATLDTFDHTGDNITDFTGLEFATNLTRLSLWHNNLSDISPIAKLTNLKWLYLDGNNITDISLIAKLTNLSDLSLGGNNITDISPIAKLTNLTGLYLWDNNLSDISPIAKLTNLTGLYLERNNITDISPLAGLTTLTTLWLSENNISDISPLVANTGLGSGDEVYVRGNPLSYQSIHTHIPALQDRGVTVEFDNVSVKVVEPVNIPDPHLRAVIEKARGKASGDTITTADMAMLTHLDAPNANVTDLTGLKYATSLKELVLWDNDITDISVVAGLTHLTGLYLGGNSIVDITSVLGLTHLTSLHLPGNNISDVSAVSGLTHLTYLNLAGTNITDLSFLSGLTNLTELLLQNNSISDLSPLIANTGLGSGDTVYVQSNPLSYQSIHTHIPALQRRGVDVEFDAGGTYPPDVNKDGQVNVLDLIFITESFGTAKGDINGDGMTDVLDLTLVGESFSQ